MFRPGQEGHKWPCFLSLSPGLAFLRVTQAPQVAYAENWRCGSLVLAPSVLTVAVDLLR